MFKQLNYRWVRIYNQENNTTAQIITNKTTEP